MTPHDIICRALWRVMDMHDADEMAEEILARIAADGFVIVQADRVIAQIACDCASEDCHQNGCKLRRASPLKE